MSRTVKVQMAHILQIRKRVDHLGVTPGSGSDGVGWGKLLRFQSLVLLCSSMLTLAVPPTAVNQSQPPN